MAGGQLHEPAEDLSLETREMHRALVSLIEELEAVDWYGQRVDTAIGFLSHDDEKLRLYLEESFSAELNGPEAAVPLLPPGL